MDRLSIVRRCGGGRQATRTSASRLAAWQHLVLDGHFKPRGQRLLLLLPFRLRRGFQRRTSLSSCSSKLDGLCSSVKLRDDTCTNCIYAHWSTFASAGCDNADVGHCCASSWSSSSPSPAGECNRCAYFGPEWKVLHELRIQPPILLGVHGEARRRGRGDVVRCHQLRHGVLRSDGLCRQDVESNALVPFSTS